MHKLLDGDRYRKVFCVGDIHGQYDKLMLSLELVGFDPETDLLLSVGDLIDRGFQNVECINMVKEPWFEAVRGNHEDLMIGSEWWRGELRLTDPLQSYRRVHYVNGGDWVDVFGADQLKAYSELLETLPHCLTATRKGARIGVVHASVPSRDWVVCTTLSDYGPSENSFLWNRELAEKAYLEVQVNIRGLHVLFYGHTPDKDHSVRKNGNTVCLDTSPEITVVDVDDFI